MLSPTRMTEPSGELVKGAVHTEVTLLSEFITTENGAQWVRQGLSIGLLHKYHMCLWRYTVIDFGRYISPAHYVECCSPTCGVAVIRIDSARRSEERYVGTVQVRREGGMFLSLKRQQAELPHGTPAIAARWKISGPVATGPTWCLRDLPIE